MSLEAVRSLLANHGFKKRKGDLFTIEMSSGVLGWVGLNRATKYLSVGEVEINPVVGVRHQEVERLVAECRGDKFHSYVPATIATPLGYVLPEARFRSWLFGGDRSAPSASDEMVAAIVEYGIAFMRSMIGLDELRRGLERDSRIGIEDVSVYRRPVVSLLLGNQQRASEELDESVAALGNRSDLASEDFRRFAAALRTRLSER
jgi:hypothetical protein